MPTLRIGDLVEATGGTLVRGSPEDRASSFEIDTRRIEAGAVFFALSGGRADGHRFLSDAARRGASAAVIEHEPGSDEPCPPALIRVDDSVRALWRCGELARKACHARFIAITGSTGKTTTKEMVAAGLGVRRRVYRTPGNFNNHLGVPLTLLGCPAEAEVAVVELGMNAPGEIAALAALVDPGVGLVTNIRHAHMEFFENLDDVAAAKGELFAVLRDEAVAVVNVDDPHVRVQSTRHRGPRVTFGQRFPADFALESVEDRFVPGAGLVVRRGDAHWSVHLRMGGAHNAWNALAALATIHAAGEDPGPAADAISRLEPEPGRCKVHSLAQGVVLVDDSYNSSPDALDAVLDTVRRSHPAGRKILVMGDMLELGGDEIAYHRQAGKSAARAGVQILVGVGSRSRLALESARKAGVPETRHADRATGAAEILPGLVRPGDLILVKGSRRVGLDKVVEALLGALVDA